MIVLSIGIVLAWVVLPSPLGLGVFERSSVGGGTFGPYRLNASNYWAPVTLPFPQCAFVVVHWSVLTGGPTNFTAGSGEFVSASDCSGPGPSNQSCLPLGCSVNGPPPVCFESGMGGMCSFTATQSEYDFYIFQVLPNNSYGPVPPGESVDLTIDFS